MSTDHKATDDLEAKRVIEEKGTIFRNRLGGVLAVTRALGDFELKDDGLSIKPSFKSIILENSNNILLIASDGLYDVCDN